MERKIKLRVQGLTNSQIQTGAYALVLAEDKGQRRIPIIVGTAEAQSIAIALEQISTPRPLTHDLFVSFCRTFGVYLREVFIYRFEDGIFYSELVLENSEKEYRIDSRTSDAIGIALRMQTDIYTTEQIVRECGVVLEESDAEENEEEEPEDSDFDLLDMEPEDIKSEVQLKRWLTLLDEDELVERMEEAVEEENYEHAKMYKDELKRREQSGK